MKKNFIQEVFKFSNSNQTLYAENYILSNSNHKAFIYISSWPNWQNNSTIIYGAEGTGKTHLAKVWQQTSKATELKLFHLTQEKLNQILDSKNNFFIDNFEQYFSQKHKLRNLDTHNFSNFEQTINEIINHCITNKKHLLLTSTQNPHNIIFKLEDLQSRISSIPSFLIGAPDENMLQTFLVKKFTDLQLKVSIDIIRFASSRLERSFSKAEEFVRELDKLSLTTKKQPSIHMARTLLNNFDNDNNATE